MKPVVDLLDTLEDPEIGAFEDTSAPTPLPAPGKLRCGPRNPRYLAFVRAQPCCVCGSRRGVEAAHTGPRGLGQKAPDSDAIPLCRGHHQKSNDSLHALGPRRFPDHHKIDIPAIIRELNKLGRKRLDSAHRAGRSERSPEFVRVHCACGWRTSWYREERDARAVLRGHLNQAEEAA